MHYFCIHINFALKISSIDKFFLEEKNNMIKVAFYEKNGNFFLNLWQKRCHIFHITYYFPKLPFFIDLDKSFILYKHCFTKKCIAFQSWGLRFLPNLYYPLHFFFLNLQTFFFLSFFFFPKLRNHFYHLTHTYNR